MNELYTFAGNVTGLMHAIDTTLSLRRAGFRTRLAERRIAGHGVVTVFATLRPRMKTPFERLNASLNRGRR